MNLNPHLSSTFLPIFKIVRLMGLYPMTHRNNKILWSPKLYTVNLVAITIFASWAIWGFTNDMTEASFLTLGFRGTIDFFITSFEVTEIITSGVFFVVSTRHKSGSIVAILDTLDKIDTIIKPKLVNQARRKSTVVTIFILIFMIVLYIFDLFMWGNNSWSGINNYAGYYILCTIDIFQEVQYWHLVNLTHHKILTMNIYIETLQKTKTNIGHISKIVKTYDSICDTIETLNSCFGTTTTMIVLSSYINLVVCPYTLLVMTSNTMDFLSYVSLVWIGVHICRLLVLVNACHECEELMRRTSRLMFRLLVCPLDHEVRKEVKVLAFKTTRKKIRFVSYGLSKIDRSLVLSVISSISSYWMILVQFSARLKT